MIQTSGRSATHIIPTPFPNSYTIMRKREKELFCQNDVRAGQLEIVAFCPQVLLGGNGAEAEHLLQNAHNEEVVGVFCVQMR